MDRFFNPRSVAVVGASRKIMKAGHTIFSNFAENKRRGLFKGELYPVNPHEQIILGFKCYPSLLKIVGEVELAVIVVPAEVVPKIMEEAAAKQVKAAVIISGGFGEIGRHDLEEKVKTISKKAGIRVLGPNCLGVLDPRTGVDMLFLPETKVLTTGDEMITTPRPMSGPVAIVTQSGAFGVSALDYLAGKQLGISKFVSFGNKYDVAEPEMLQYLLHDEETGVILLYVESIELGKAFMEIAKEITIKKPIVAMKLGRTEAGARAAMSHTGSIAGSDMIYDGVFSQVGIIRVRNMKEFFDVGKAFAFQLPASGRNIAIITDAGGPGIMAADECESNGLIVKKFSRETMRKFEELKRVGKIPSFATNLNPLDLTGSVNSAMYETSAAILFEDPEIHGIIVLGLHHTPGLLEDFVDRIAKLSQNHAKPIVACDIGETEMAMFIRSRFDKFGIPAYSSPEDAARAMAALVKYGLYLQKNGSFVQYMKSFWDRTRSS
ncbi:MAG: CoA-binding protein [Candidatus Bathyarchaeota archaeon]|nr:MAG: CoA-binding protein [Candidatus Bathyarchaeota archaeon]